MTPVERFLAASAKLQRLRDAAGFDESPGGWLVELVTVGTESNPWQEQNPVTHDELLVTLHRTIDAQLALLQAAQIEHTDVMTAIERPYWDAALALADAIIGAES